MSAERLRQAAKVLRQWAEDASEGEWWPVRTGLAGVDGEWIVDSGPTFICSTRIDSERGKADAEYIATMHPDVGLDIADWLDEEAERIELAAADGEDARPWWPAIRAAERILGRRE